MFRLVFFFLLWMLSITIIVSLFSDNENFCFALISKINNKYLRKFLRFFIFISLTILSILLAIYAGVKTILEYINMF